MVSAVDHLETKPFIFLRNLGDYVRQPVLGLVALSYGNVRKGTIETFYFESFKEKAAHFLESLVKSKVVTELPPNVNRELAWKTDL